MKCKTAGRRDNWDRLYPNPHQAQMLSHVTATENRRGHSKKEMSSTAVNHSNSGIVPINKRPEWENILFCEMQLKFLSWDVISSMTNWAIKNRLWINKVILSCSGEVMLTDNIYIPVVEGLIHPTASGQVLVDGRHYVYQTLWVSIDSTHTLNNLSGSPWE